MTFDPNIVYGNKIKGGTWAVAVADAKHILPPGTKFIVFEGDGFTGWIYQKNLVEFVPFTKVEGHVA